ncbi:MAG: flagellar biosynthesis anti-sigma factor FlgM [Vicinamibacterales bacterium]
MKIEQNRAGLDQFEGVRGAEVRDEKAAAAERAVQDKRADQVRLSSTGQLAATAASAANDAPDVRPEAVERGRALLASGELGRDPDRLANALIDHLLDKG